MRGLVIAVDDPLTSDVAALLDRHLQFARSCTLPGFVFALDADELVRPDIILCSARRDGRLLAVGALKELDASHGELKSMHTSVEARGCGVGMAMVEHLVGLARRRGYARVSLETGAQAEFEPARNLYAACRLRGVRSVRQLPRQHQQRFHDAVASSRELIRLPSCGVAYDEELAHRVRALLDDEPGLTEQRMFGGLAFLIGGNMAVAASGQGGLMVRVDPAESDAILATTNARPMEMRGKPMRGWLRIDADDLRTKRQLSRWVTLGTTFARSLPAKRPPS